MTPPTPRLDPTILLGVCTRDFSSFMPNARPITIDQGARVEKKTFPSSEVFDFDTELKKEEHRVDANDHGRDAREGGPISGVRFSGKASPVAQNLCYPGREGERCGKVSHSFPVSVRREGGGLRQHSSVGRRGS
jgi:hypothetical protein